jgi:hypothetical protein
VATILLCTLSIAAQVVGPDAPAKPGDVRTVLRDFIESSDGSLKFESAGTPVNAATCRIHDRRSGKWVTRYDHGVAVHLRYRSGNDYGSVLHSSIVFLDGNKILDSYPTGAVRSSDPRLMKEPAGVLVNGKAGTR